MIRRAILAIALLLAAGCGDSPVGPSDPQLAASGAAGITPVSISLSGRTELTHPGDTSQLAATLTMSDGTTRDVTRDAAWAPGGQYGVLSISKEGLLKAVGYGRAQVSVTYSVRATAPVSVLPPGTHLLQGLVGEGTFRVGGAKVEVALASGTQYSTVTFPDGHYALPAAGAVTLRVEKDGYAPQVKQLTVGRDEEVNFDIRRNLDSADIRGVYTLTMTASASCKLPSQYMRRTYTARIDGADGMLGVVVAGADMEAWGDAGFRGFWEGDALRFDISDSYLTDAVFIERVEPSMNLAYSGLARGSFANGRIVATLNGSIQYRSVMGAVQVDCYAGDHRMEFVRQ